MDVTWRKSSYSGGNGGNCIEVGPQGRVILKIAADKVNTPRLLGR